MNPFKHLISLVGLHAESTGEQALLFALATYSASVDSEPATGNPITACLQRWQAAGINGHAIARIRAMTNDAESRFAAGASR